MSYKEFDEDINYGKRNEGFIMDNEHKILKHFLRNAGPYDFNSEKTIWEWIDKYQFKRVNAISPSTILFMDALLKAGMLDPIYLTANIETLQDFIRTRYIVATAGEDLKKHDIRVGDIIFYYVSDTTSSYLYETRVGVVYRVFYGTEYQSSVIWVIGADSSDTVCTTVLNAYSECITAICKPRRDKDTEDTDFNGTLLTLTTDPDIVSDGTIRYIGEVMLTDPDKEFITMRLGPDDTYAEAAYWPKLYRHNYVAVYDQFSSRIRGDKQWLLVGVDDTCCGYVPKDAICSTPGMTLYQSGKVCVHQTVTLRPHKPLFATAYTNYMTSQNFTPKIPCKAEVLDINLSSSNPYFVTYQDMCNTCTTWKGWVRPDAIVDLV